VTIADAVTAVADALEAAGCRVAVRSGDITPPVFYLRLGAVGEAGGTLAGALVPVLWAYYIPVRGVDNLPADAAALDAAYQALGPLAVAELTTTATSVTVIAETWPCYRLDVFVLSQPALTP
jgi:hypothetical protein